MRIKRVAALVAALVVLAGGATPAMALDQSQGRSYTQDENGRNISMPTTYEFTGVLGGDVSTGTNFKSPQDMFLAPDGYLYVADTGNNRIVKMGLDGKFVAEFKNEEDEKKLNNPKGVYVDEEGNIYVADTTNGRVVKMDGTGKQIWAYGKPESDLLSGISSYEPTKIGVSATGMLYILMGKQFMTVSDQNEFAGYVGSTEVGFNLLNMLVRMFASEEQIKKITKVQPPQYNNFTISPEGMVYAITYGTTNQLRQITSVGKNIYPSGLYGEWSYNINHVMVRPNFSDLVVSRDGIVYAVEQNSKMIYQYDQEGNMLSTFGGSGDNRGHFLSPAAMELDEQGNLYVLDMGRGNVQKLSPTPFMNKILEGSRLYDRGEYDASYDVWKEVSNIHESYPLSRNRMADVLYKRKEYKASMEQYKIAANQEGYGKAEGKLRHEWIIHNFFFVMIMVLAAVILGVFGLSRLKRLVDKWNRRMFNMEE